MSDTIQEPYARWEVACGDYADEKAGLLDLDDRITRTGLFAIHREVRGNLLHPLPNSEAKDMRIDRILTPTAKLLDRGWHHGFIGVEAKAPGEKMGPALSQAMDYMRTVFFSPSHHGRIMLNWVVLWPFESPFGPTESILAHHRIATCAPRPRGIYFKSTGKALLYHNYIDDVTTIKPTDTLRKNGSR